MVLLCCTVSRHTGAGNATVSAVPSITLSASPARAPPLAEDSLPAPVAARARVRPLGHEALAAAVTDFREAFHAPHNLRARELDHVCAGPRANAREGRPIGAREMAHHAPAALAAA